MSRHIYIGLYIACGLLLQVGALKGEGFANLSEEARKKHKPKAAKTTTKATTPSLHSDKAPMVVVCEEDFSYVVPKNLRLGNLKLHLTDRARQEIQDKVNELLVNKKGVITKAKRAQLYFSIIEQVFAEEGVPDQIKYLSIQESALVGDIVSSSNAVGYWQFKAPTAQEVDLRIDKVVDERMHIAAASRGAATYLKHNYSYFKNWAYAITAYYTGRGGAKKYIIDKYINSDKMIVGSRTHWYVKTFIAHWLAYEHVLSTLPPAEKILQAKVVKKKQKTMGLAHRYRCTEQDIIAYNPWMRRHVAHINDVVLVLVPNTRKNQNRQVVLQEVDEEDGDIQQTLINVQAVLPNWLLYKVTINKLPALVAEPQDDVARLAAKAGISSEQLRFYNELPEDHTVQAGTVYYLTPKRTKALVHYHITEKAERLYDISQHYGMRLRSLAKKNRLPRADTLLEKGTVLWLRKRRPKGTPLRRITFPEKRAIPPLKNISPDTTTWFPYYELEEADQHVIEEEEIKVVQPITSTYHMVVPGETPYGIAMTYGLELEDFMAWNNLKGGMTIRPGQRLRIIPRHGKPPTAQRTVAKHKVAVGETLYQIAARYNVTVEEIKAWNQLSSDRVMSDSYLDIQATNTLQRAKRKVKESVKDVTQQAEQSVKEGYEAVEDRAEAAYDAAEQSVKEGYEAAEDRAEAAYDAAEQSVKEGYEAAEDRTEANYDAVRERAKEGYETVGESLDPN